MKINHSLTPRNKNGDRHGYWESYTFSKFLSKGHYINGSRIGYWEFFTNNKITQKQYFIL